MRKSKDRKSTRLNSSHQIISYAVFCLKKKTGSFVTPLRLFTLCNTLWIPGKRLRIRCMIRQPVLVGATVFVTGRASFRIVVFFNDTATTEIYTLSLHDALPI